MPYNEMSALEQVQGNWSELALLRRSYSLWINKLDEIALFSRAWPTHVLPLTAYPLV